MIGLLVILAFFGTWIVATAIYQREEEDWVVAVLIGLVAAIMFPITWMSFGIVYFAKRLVRFMDETEEQRDSRP